MTVAETTTIDQVAAHDGRLLLAMTEVRPYASGDTAALVEDFRLKLNAYVYAIRSGQVSDPVNSAPPTGHDIVLFCPDEPPTEVQDMIRLANEALGPEKVTVGWRILDTLGSAAAAESAPPSELTVDQLPVALAKAIVAALPPGWTHASYRPAVIVGRSEDELVVRLSDGTDTTVDPPARARELVPWLKHKMYVPGRGTWLSASFTVVSDGNLYPEYNYDEEPSWGRPVAGSSYADELDAYPRDQEHLPQWWSDRIS